MNVIPILILIVCMAVSFLFSGMEAGVFALSRLRIRQLMRAGQPRAELLHRFLERPEDFLWTILIGNTLANFLGVSLFVYLLYGWLHQLTWLFLPIFLVTMFGFYAFCDLLPKMLFRLYPNRLCLMLVTPFQFIHVALTASQLVGLVRRLADGLLRWTGGKVFTGHLFSNRDELRLVMQESSQGLTSEERVMINRVLDLQNLTVRQISLPIDKAVTVGQATAMSDVLALCREKKFTRLPVWQEDGKRRRIAGVVSLKTLLYLPELNLQKAAGDYMQPALYFDEEMRLEAALGRMQKSGMRLAIVLSRDKREIGIVCLQDIFRAVFGEVSL